MKIQQLKIQTSNFEQQLEFYQNTLNLEILKKTNSKFTAKIGWSNLEFVRCEKSVPYHLAFHIGANQEEEALEWLKKRVSILKNEGNEIVDFPNWNAKSLYFYDEDANIIEFISRSTHFLDRSFLENKLLGIAEIGLPTDMLKENVRFLNQYFRLEIYYGSPEVFCAIGNDEGLLIAVDQHKKTWFPTQDKALPADFDLKFEREGKVFELNYENGKLDIL